MVEKGERTAYAQQTTHSVEKGRPVDFEVQKVVDETEWRERCTYLPLEGSSEVTKAMQTSCCCFHHRYSSWCQGAPSRRQLYTPYTVVAPLPCFVLSVDENEPSVDISLKKRQYSRNRATGRSEACLGIGFWRHGKVSQGLRSEAHAHGREDILRMYVVSGGRVKRYPS